MKIDNRGMKAKRTGMSILVVMAMIVSGFAVLPSTGVTAVDNLGGPYGGSLRVALKDTPTSLNPLAASLNEPAKQVIEILYESLGRQDPYTLELEPWLASGWEIDPANALDVTVTLKAGILWHDGSELSIDDIEYSFGADGYNLDYISSMAKNYDNRSITFSLVSTDARFFSEAMLLKIVPVGFTPTSDENGCGPFQLVSQDAESITVEAFNDHFNARPYLDTVTFTYYPYTVADWSADYPISQIFTDDPRYDGFYRAAYDLIKDKIDFIGWDLTTNQTTANIEVDGNNTNLLLNANTTLVRSNGLKQWYLGFNNADDNILSDVNLRKAISYAINKAALTVYDISGGLESSNCFISKYDTPWYNNTIDYHGYDVATATQILNDAGYMAYNSTGYICAPGPDPAHPEVNATEISLTLLGPQIEDVTPYTMSTNIITWFENLGIKVTLASNITTVNMDKVINDDFDMFLATEESAAIDPQFMNGIYGSAGIAANTNLLNFAATYKVENASLMNQITNVSWEATLDHANLVGDVMVYHNGTLVPDTEYTVDLGTGIFTLDNTFVLDYANDTLNITYTYLPFDNLMDKANAQLDPAMRAKYIKEAQALLADLEPAIPLFSYRVSHAYKSDVYVGWVQTLGGLMNYWTFTNLQNEIVDDSVVTLSGVKSALTQGENMNLFVKVQDTNGAPVTDSQLFFAGEGTFGTPVYDEGGQQYTVPYTAPATAVSKTVTLSVEAYTRGYITGSDSIDITVHPAVKNFIVEITRGNTTLPSGGTTSISVNVMDKTAGTAVSGANVILTLSPTGLGGYLEEYTGTTTAAGEFVTTFGSANVTIDTTFRITAYVSKEGYVDAEQTTSISVSRDPTIQAESTDNGFLGLPAPAFLTVLVMFGAMSIVYVTARRKRN